MRKLTILFVFLSCYQIEAQQLPQYSQYTLNSFLLNPAQVGFEGMTTFSSTSRQQWLGMKDAPRFYSFSAQTRLAKRKKGVKYSFEDKSSKVLDPRSGRVGLGLNLVSDLNGFVNNTTLSMAYSYRIMIHDAMLVFGLSGSVLQLSIAQKAVILRNQSDPSLNSMGQTFYSPDASTGVYFSLKNYYAGLSVIQLFQSKIRVGTEALGNYEINRHYYLTGGYRLALNRKINLEPSILLKTTEQFVPQADLTCQIKYLEDYWGGLSYRTNNAFVVLAGMRIRMLFVGYAFDYGMNSYNIYSYGSHELTLMMKLGKMKRPPIKKKKEDWTLK
jgi:type IX secretion system PorP/SprF family membrane protein